MFVVRATANIKLIKKREKMKRKNLVMQNMLCSDYGIVCQEINIETMRFNIQLLIPIKQKLMFEKFEIHVS